MEDNQPPVVQDEERGEQRGAGQAEAWEVSDTPELALNLQTMSISAPRIQNLRATQVSSDPQIESCYNLLMKVACTGGTPRFLSQQAISQAMARAWRHHFHAISQVSEHLFMAHFTSQESMMFVYTRQPWSMGSDNILLEWIDPIDESKIKEDYKFEYIYVNVRVYGVPRNHRSLSLLQRILSIIGKPSEFHPLQESMMFARPDYIWGTTKFHIKDSVIDKINLTLDDNTSKMVYLHYERIGRICRFCGVMFHTVQHCQKRNGMIMARVRHGSTAEDIPFFRYGEWVTNSEKIPKQPSEQERATNPILSRFQRMFQEDKGNDNGKRVITEELQSTRWSPMHISYEKGIRGEFFMGQTSSAANSATTGQQITAKETTNQILTIGDQEQQKEGNAFAKLAMHDSHLSQEILSANQQVQSINALEGQIEGVNKEQRLLQSIQLTQQAGPTIRKAPEICDPAMQIGAISTHGKKEERMKDILPSTESGNFNTCDSRFFPSGSGGPIRNRFNFTERLGNRTGIHRIRSATLEKAGCPYTTRSSRSSAGLDSHVGEDCNSCHINNPSPTSNAGSLGSHYGALSPQTTVNNTYVGMDADADYGDTGKATQIKEQAQDIGNTNTVALPILETHFGGNMDVDGAMAPALKAPRAP
ncbi:uncharacterized protein LOC119353172 [Triticum dicoccoides]|uniref:uncharacterized protein LOC119353172 n=1 Tax=Triticum dicoccoides TaxID=85692 RepID=UPI000E789B42|nr:uncharacterized protein LOC119353172 [Triticum dicoccoides]